MAAGRFVHLHIRSVVYSRLLRRSGVSGLQGGIKNGAREKWQWKKKSTHELDATVQRRFIRRKHFTNVNCSFHPTIAATLSTVNDVEKMDASLGEGKITNRKRPA